MRLDIGYRVLSIGYWCLAEISVNFKHHRIVKYNNRKKYPDAGTQPG
jgi:hypothetical protein